MSDVEIRPIDMDQIAKLEKASINERQAHIIQSTLEQGKRHYGMPAATLTHLKDPKMKGKLPEGWKPEVLETAIKAEQRTSDQLQHWMEEHPQAVLIDSLHIPGKEDDKNEADVVDPDTGLVDEGDTDHILILGSNVWLIDTKAWKGKATYKVTPEGEVTRNNRSFPGGKVHMNQAGHMWLDYFTDPETEVLGFIYINNEDPDTKVFRDRSWYKPFWSLCENGRFFEWLDKQYSKMEAGTGDYINGTIVAEAVICATAPYDPRKGLIRTDVFNQNRKNPYDY